MGALIAFSVEVTTYESQLDQCPHSYTRLRVQVYFVGFWGCAPVQNRTEHLLQWFLIVFGSVGVLDGVGHWHAVAMVL